MYLSIKYRLEMFFPRQGLAFSAISIIYITTYRITLQVLAVGYEVCGQATVRATPRQ